MNPVLKVVDNDVMYLYQHTSLAIFQLKKANQHFAGIRNPPS